MIHVDVKLVKGFSLGRVAEKLENINFRFIIIRGFYISVNIFWTLTLIKI